jgi:hypothetical protein
MLTILPQHPELQVQTVVAVEAAGVVVVAVVSGQTLFSKTVAAVGVAVQGAQALR